jgi:hypothetical protein
MKEVFEALGLLVFTAIIVGVLLASINVVLLEIRVSKLESRSSVFTAEPLSGGSWYCNTNNVCTHKEP